jgi:ubiquinone/menaquinone biosynthesis C-methylase UbiE
LHRDPEKLETEPVTTPSSDAQHQTEAQYRTEANLRTRIETHQRYSVGTPLETLVDGVLKLEGMEALLDIGTGPGDFPGRLRFEGHTGRLTGLDASPGMVARASTKHAGVEFVQGDAMALPFADSGFDVVTARHMLYHVPDIHAALLEARRVMKPDARFMALTNADGYMREFWDAVTEALEGDTVFQRFLEEIMGPKFFHGDLERHLRNAFDEVNVTVIDQWLEFPDPTPVLRYWDTMLDGSGISDADWTRGHQKLRTTLETRCSGGQWRVWKGVAFLEGK